MNNVHPLFKAALAPVFSMAAVSVSPTLHAFDVRIWINGELHELNVMAFTSCDAITKAIDIYFDGEEAMPEGLEISARPYGQIPRAA